MRSNQYLAAFAAVIAPTFAQTFTSCNPLQKTCPADPALGKSVFYDFTSAPPDWTAAAGTAPTFQKDGAHFTITKAGDSPTLSSSWYIMFGHVKIVMSAAAGKGIVSSVVLESNDLDEVDLEWVGSDLGTLQTNYFGKGNTTTYDRGLNFADGSGSGNLVTYEVDWTSDHLQWLVNGKVVRTLTPATADYNQYPQTPMQVKLGNWCAGDSPNAGTSSWAGGPVDFSQGPFTMLVKSIEVTDYSTGSSYSYGDTSGTWQSIKSSGGQISGAGSVPGSVSTASGTGSTLTGKPTASALTETLISATTTASQASLQTGSGATTITTSVSGPTVGSGNATVGTTPTTSSSTPSGSPTTGGVSNLKASLAGLVAAGLLAVLAL